jgi:hypothetical protein
VGAPTPNISKSVDGETLILSRIKPPHKAFKVMIERIHFFRFGLWQIYLPLFFHHQSQELAQGSALSFNPIR